ncbi:DUF397 domain-containing protein [Kitasatospora sp. NBC_00240]|uniref:DUF397 domain-containing protein n=1 Tax=Kitasatospora sp. NBC_00240 TaxID=2903567 RepID=UPI0022538165|nr:DUF397 domain-containing protein [Kitasatospora sp. NBC_00240]MCX5212583.1 DUF397 domain-containing protein [Kitasatospora sp. NBC_00240]
MNNFVRNSAELDVAWQKSSFSGGNGNCVEIASVGSFSYVRDSKDSQGPALILDVRARREFLAAVATGEFDFDLF